MADLARRATRWVGTLSDGNVHVKFRLRNGGDITYWNFAETRFGDIWPWPLTYNSENICQSQRSHTQCACQVSWWSVEKWRRYYILKFHGNTFRWPTTLTFDLKLSVTVYPYVICMPSFIMIGWEMAEILHFEILRKHGQTHKHTNKQTNKQTWALQYLALPPMGGEVTNRHGHYNTSPSPLWGAR